MPDWQPGRSAAKQSKIGHLKFQKRPIKTRKLNQIKPNQTAAFSICDLRGLCGPHAKGAEDAKFYRPRNMPNTRTRRQGWKELGLSQVCVKSGDGHRPGPAAGGLGERPVATPQGW